jgi:hypothetical protein
MQNMAEIKGSCRCGKVTLVSAADPVFVGVCHCKSCQKSTGTSYASVLAVPTASLSVSGATTRFDDVADSGNATHRNFCPACGSTVTRSSDVMDGLTMIPIGSLDDPSAVRPTMQIYCDSALPWAKVEGLQSFAKMPGPG